MYNVCLFNNNIVDINSDQSQVLRIDCEAPTTREQTSISDTTTWTSNIVEYPSKTTTISPQSTTIITKEDTPGNDQIAGNIISRILLNIKWKNSYMKVVNVYLITIKHISTYWPTIYIYIRLKIKPNSVRIRF